MLDNTSSPNGQTQGSPRRFDPRWLGLILFAIAAAVLIFICVVMSIRPAWGGSTRVLATLAAVFAFLTLCGLAVIAFILAMHLRLARRAVGYERPSPGKPQESPPGDLHALTERVTELSRTMSRAVHLLEEVNENTLLDEPSRQVKFELFARQHRNAVFLEVDRLFHRRRWAHAAVLLDGLDQKYPDNDDVKEYVKNLNELRKQALSEDIARTRKNIDNLVAISAWDKAAAEAETLLEQHPDAEPVKQLVAHVLQQRERFREEQLKRLSNEIQKCVTRKRWTDAMQAARQLIDKYPDSPEAAGIEDQIPTLTENANIEKRQQLEEQIRDLIRRRNFLQAQELAGHVIETYPDSPQANALRGQLAKLKKLAADQEQEFRL